MKKRIEAADKLAVIYARVSTEEQAKKGYSLPEQLEACRDKAASLGYPPQRIVECVDDEGAPGEFLNRPGLDKARELVRQGNVGAFICMDPDRFSRDLLNQLLADRELQKAGVRLEFVLFNLERTPMGQAFFSFRGIMSELEKAMIMERTMRGKLGKAKRGGITHPVGPYGYVFLPETDEIVEDTSPADPARPSLGTKADIARQMFRWAADGDGFHAITRRLNDLGLPSPRGSIWHRNTVQHILRNEVYAGTLYLHRFEKRGVAHNRFRPEEEKIPQRIRPREEWIPVSVPALIDRELWQEAQRQLAIARRKRSGLATRDYLLSGLVRCGYCGSTVHGSTTRQHGQSYSWYVCTARNPGLVSKPKCHLRHLRAEPLEETVWAKVRGWVLAPESFFADLQVRSETAVNAQKELEMNTRALSGLTDAQSRIVRLVAKGLIPEDQAEAELSQIKASQTRILARQRELTGQVEAALSSARRQEINGLAASVRDRIDFLSFEERRHVVRLLVAEVVVRDPPEVTIKPR